MNNKWKKWFSDDLKAVISSGLAILTLSAHLPGAMQGESLDGWGIQMILLALGVFGMFWIVRQHKAAQNRLLNVLSALFSLFIVIGPSFAQLQSWDILFVGTEQKIRTFVLWAGYCLICKNCVLFVCWLAGQFPQNLWRREAHSKIEEWLFEKHSFVGTLSLVFIFAIPWLINFFPGTLEPDARGQIEMAFGYNELTGHHPVASTKLMGLAMLIGQSLFHSDNMGIFIYAITQYLSIISYVGIYSCKGYRILYFYSSLCCNNHALDVYTEYNDKMVANCAVGGKYNRQLLFSKRWNRCGFADFIGGVRNLQTISKNLNMGYCCKSCLLNFY